jgi:Tol biopolymer transport system component
LKLRLLVTAIVFTVLTVMLIGCARPSTEPAPSATSRIAHAFVLDGNPDICVIDADGSNFRNLTNSPALDLEPTWSPDGSRIAFSSYQGLNGDIYVVRELGDICHGCRRL